MIVTAEKKESKTAAKPPAKKTAEKKAPNSKTKKQTRLHTHDHAQNSAKHDQPHPPIESHDGHAHDHAPAAQKTPKAPVKKAAQPEPAKKQLPAYPQPVQQTAPPPSGTAPRKTKKTSVASFSRPVRQTGGSSKDQQSQMAKMALSPRHRRLASSRRRGTAPKRLPDARCIARPASERISTGAREERGGCDKHPAARKRDRHRAPSGSSQTHRDHPRGRRQKNPGNEQVKR